MHRASDPCTPGTSTLRLQAAASTPSQAAVTEFLRELGGKTPIVELARGCGVNRLTLSRWMNGQSEARLPDFLRQLDP